MTPPAISPQQIGVIGPGMIGVSIAHLTAQSGMDVFLKVSPRPGALGRAQDAIQASFAREVTAGRTSNDQASQALCRTHVCENYADLSDCDVVIECVPEDLELKRQVLGEAETVLSDHCVLASTTSSLCIGWLAEGRLRPENMVGMHYFWPAHRQPLIEIAIPSGVSVSAFECARRLARQQGRRELLVRDLPGFFTTRIMQVWGNEAIALVVEGVPVDRVDRAMVEAGWAVGPFRFVDMVGIDTAVRIYESTRHYLGMRVDHLGRLGNLVQEGYTGYKGRRRAGVKGFYVYPEGREVDPRVYALLGQRERPYLDNDDIAQRMIWQMVNEVAHCLAEGVITSPTDAMLGAVLGTGWPRGGPVSYVREVGVTNMTRKLAEWAALYGPRFTPSRGLEELAREEA